MKKLNLVCPNCNSKNARQWSWRNMFFHDDDYYKFLKEQGASEEDCKNKYVAKCICDDCGHHFEASVTIDIEVSGIEVLKEA